MKKYLFILALPLLMLVSACDKTQPTVYTNPTYTASYNNLPDSIKSVVTTKYNAKKKEIGTVKEEYDMKGRLVRRVMIDENGDSIVLTWGYDKRGRIADAKHSMETDRKYSNTYNEKGQLSHEEFILDVSDEGFESGYYIDYAYDDEGRIISETTMYIDSDGVFVDYEYENGMLHRVTTMALSDSTVCEFNDKGLMAEVRDYDTALPPKKQLQFTSVYEYEYDDNGNWIKSTEKQKRKVKNIETRTLALYTPDDYQEALAAAQALAENSNFVDDYMTEVQDRETQKLENEVLLWILIGFTALFTILCLIYLHKSKGWFNNFGGKTLSNGMKRLWIYNKEPYIKVSVIVPVLIVSFVTGIILLFIFGGLTWLLLWILKIILWIILIFGWICLVGGILGLLARSGYGCLLVIVGGLIVAAQDWVKETGDKMVEWGFNFLNELSLFGWGAQLFTNYWDVIMLFFVLPLLIFLSIAAILIVLDMLLIGFEWVVTKIYSIRRPCPTCGNTGTPDYLVRGQKHPVDLRPSFYGVFSHRSPVTGEKLPTMLFNGRGKLTRRCRNCQNIINAETDQTFGTEKHFGIVGNRSSGKSYLLYHGLALLMEKYPERLSQIDVDNDTNIQNKHDRIRRREDIQTNMSKFYRAVQLIMKRKLQPVPYHLFFYDVAGEQFNVASMSNKAALDFYRNVESIAFVIDPSMLDISGKAIGRDFQKWFDAHGKKEQYDTEGTLAVLQDILERADNSSHKININFVLTKSDTGYLAACSYPDNIDSATVERYMQEQLGLSNLINTARSSFKEVGFFAVNVNDDDEADVYALFEGMLGQRGVKF